MMPPARKSGGVMKSHIRAEETTSTETCASQKDFFVVTDF